jgi:putative membrane protein
MMYFGGWLWMLISGLIFVVFFVLLIVLIIRLARGPGWHMRGHEGPGGEGFVPPWGKMDNKALEILNERYAKGEIDEEEYKKRKENLMK